MLAPVTDLVDNGLPLLLSVFVKIQAEIGSLPDSCQKAFQKVTECTQKYGGNLQGADTQVLDKLVFGLEESFNACLTDPSKNFDFLAFCLKIEILVTKLGDPTCNNDPSLDLILQIVVQLEVLVKNPPSGTVISDLLDVVLTQLYIFTNYLPCILNLNNLDFFLTDVLNALVGAVEDLPNLEAALANIMKYQKLFIQECNGSASSSTPCPGSVRTTPSCGCQQ